MTTCNPAAADTAADPFMRACLAQLMYELASDKNELRQFTGQLWLTYPKGRRLVPRPISGNMPKIFTDGKTFPEALLSLADMMATPHGHVVCHSLIDPGFDGAIAIGHTVHWDQDARHLTRPRPSLIGVIVQLGTGRELLLSMDVRARIAVEPDSDEGLVSVVANTWTLAETIANMTRAPLGEDALALAQEILDVEPSIMLGSGRQVKASSDVEGSGAWAVARGFLNKVAAVTPRSDDTASADRRPRRRPGTIVIGDMNDVNVYTTRDLDPVQPSSARTYRAIE